jgi:transaldolase
MDHLDRGLIESGELQQMIETYDLRGITSNPAIFEKAIAHSNHYDRQIEAGVKANKSTQEIYESLIFEDIRNACDIFRPIYDASNGTDGFVSIEVSPHLAHDTQGTIEEVQRFYDAVDRENVMIKIPGTEEGFEAIETSIAKGINVNVTLLFAVEKYTKAAEAYMRGLEARLADGNRIDTIASVASFFLSRIDTKVDNFLQERQQRNGTETLNREARLDEVAGKVAIANAKVAYQHLRSILDSDRWQALADRGANIQRLLWASTSTKNPAYSDVRYVNTLVGQHTVNTMPISTLQACADHCDIMPGAVETEVDEAKRLLASLSDEDIHIDLDQVMEELLTEGIDKFVQPFDSLMTAIRQKAEGFTPVRA